MDNNIPRKKKVLLCITKGNFGGAQRYVYELATNIPKEEFEVVVACGEGETLREKLKEKNIRVVDLESSRRDINIVRDIKAFFEIKRLIRKERPDIIHLNSSKIGGLGALAGRIEKVPNIIFTAHAWAFNENRGFLSKTVIKILHFITILLSHTTIAVAEKIKNSISSLSIVKEKIVVIHNGIKNFKILTKKDSLEKLGLPKTNKTVIISISELHPNKGIDIAIKAISFLPQEKRNRIIYLVLGDGEEKSILNNLIEALNMKDHIKFLGFVPDAKSLLSGADLFLLPSRTEAFPYVILEAGLSGIPIIATSVGGIPETIKDMQNGILVPPRNPREIAEAISYYLDHKEKQKEFSKNIKQTISEFFTFDKMLTDTLDIYRLFN
ncbi:MAG TPA: glycosyltransferase family 4 protein [Candidatus Paceibacterota bacterium]